MDIISRIKRSSDMMSVMLNQLNTGIYVIDKAYDIVSFNDQFDAKTKETLFTKTTHFCDNIVGCLGADKDEDCDVACQFCNQCEIVTSIKLALEKNMETRDVIIVRQHGTKANPIRKYYKYSCKPMDLEGEIVAILMVEDITKMENSRAEMYEQHQMIQKYNERYQHDLALAKLVQKGIIPTESLSRNEYTIDFIYYPLDEIGGDMFDIVEIDDTHIGIFMCDVIGHGLPAALVTTMIKALLSGDHNYLSKPSELMNHLNASLINMVTDPYMTALYGVLDTEHHCFKFVRAGHPYPWKISNSGIQTFGHLKNPMIGLNDKISYFEEEITVESNSKIMIYTDGLLETATRDGSYEKQVLSMLEENPDLAGNNLLSMMRSDLDEAAEKEKYMDDVCVLMIERK